MDYIYANYCIRKLDCWSEFRGVDQEWFSNVLTRVFHGFNPCVDTFYIAWIKITGLPC